MVTLQKKLCIVSFLILFILFYSPVISQPKKSFFKHSYPSIEVEGKFWLGTPFGLYQYSNDEDIWTKYDINNGLPSDNITILEYKNDFLWVGTDKGAAYINIRRNTIFSFDTSDGLPDNYILSIAFEKDFTWVGTIKGAARFDNLIEKWESFTPSTGLKGEIVNNIFTENNIIWIITESHINEYDISFEKWRYFSINDEKSGNYISHSISAKDNLWLLCENRIAKFNKKLRSIQFYQKDNFLEFQNLNDISIKDDQLWIAGKAGIAIYEPNNDAFREFPEQNNLPEININNFAFSEDGKEIWFVTSKGLFNYRTEQKTWYTYSIASGLTRNVYRNIALSNGNIFAIFNDTIDYYRPDQSRWYTYFLKKGEKAKEEMFSFDRERGSFINLGKGLRLDLSGLKSSILFENKIIDLFNNNEFNSSDRSFARSDLKAKLELPGKRTLNAFYNNNDFNETIYGIKFKGNRDDWLQDISWGDINSEQGKKQIIDPVSIFGYGTRMEFGAKTDKYKRSMLNVIGYAGQKTIAFDNDFFKGTVSPSRNTTRDIDFIKNQYFQFDSTNLSGLENLQDDEIYIDDNISLNNTPNTFNNFIIAGVMGNFDKLTRVKDYNLNKKRGNVLLNFPVSDSSVVVIRYRLNNILFEKVLQNKFMKSIERSNCYFLGGKSILPYSLKIKIFDSRNQEHSLHEFGIDENNDGKVDLKFLDFSLGTLEFPQKFPFPLSAYNSLNPISEYQIRIEFESNISIFYLKHKNLVRGSETLSIDGQQKIPGEDYIIDYTSGTLLFVKEGVLNDDSEIDINYEYYHTVDEYFYQAGVGTGPTDNLWAEANYISFDKIDPADNKKKTVNTITGFSEIKWNMFDLDFRITPEFAHSSSKSGSGNNISIGSNISSKKIRVFANIKSKETGYEELFDKKFKLGKLKSETEGGFQYDPFEYIRISGRLRNRSGFSDSIIHTADENHLEGSVLFNKPLLPILSLNAQKIKTELNDSSISRTTVRADLEYILPENFLRGLSIQSLVINFFFRKSDEYINILSKEPVHNMVQNTYSRIGFSPVELITINSYFRHNSLDFGSKEILPAKTDDKLFIEAINDKIRGINLGIRYSGELWWYYDGTSDNISDNRSLENFQISSRIFPGQWIDILNTFTFEMNYQSNHSAYYTNINQRSSWLFSFLDMPEISQLTQFNADKFYQYRSEWRPISDLTYYLTFELSNLNSVFWNSTLKNKVLNVNNRIDFKPDMFTFISAQVNYQKEERGNYYYRNRYTPSFWIENRWSENFLTRLNIYSYLEKIDQTNISQNNFNIVPLLTLIYKNSSLWFLGNVEFKDDISFSYFNTDGFQSGMRNCSYSNSIYFDFFPLPFAIFRLRMSNILLEDIFDDQNSYWNHTFQARIIIQF